MTARNRTLREPACRSGRAFTLIELLVVIAIIAILMAMLMPAFSTANDKANITQCEANLHAIGLGLQMFLEDRGHYPKTLDELYDLGYVQDRDALSCVKTGRPFVYKPPVAGAPRDAVVASCVSTHTPKPNRPHGFGTSFCVLLRNGKVEERQ
jgi:prepilin-type N-terminal cleavage/methylation domain-containing protein